MRLCVKPIIALFIVLALSCGSCLASFSARYFDMPINGRDFILAYNNSLNGIKSLSWDDKYDKEQLASISFDAGENISLILRFSNDNNIEEISVEKGTATPTNFEYLCAVVFTALKSITPDCTDEQRYTAITSLFVSGILENRFDTEGYSACQLGDSGEFALVYAVNERQRRFYMFRGTVG